MPSPIEHIYWGYGEYKEAAEDFAARHFGVVQEFEDRERYENSCEGIRIPYPQWRVKMELNGEVFYSYYDVWEESARYYVDNYKGPCTKVAVEERIHGGNWTSS